MEMLRKLESQKIDKAFADRCVSIYEKLCPWSKGSGYLSRSCVCVYASGRKEWVIEGRYHHVVRRFDHEPSDKEINNAIVTEWNMRHDLYMR